MRDREKFYLAFDLGASGGRAILGNLTSGRIHIEELHRFANPPVYFKQRRFWDLYLLYEEILQGMRICHQDKGIVPVSLAVDTWGVDFGLLDAEGILIGLPFSYRDSFTEGAVESFLSRISAEQVYAWTGIQFLPFNTLFQLHALRNHYPHLLEKAETLLFMPDLFNYLLTDKKKTELTIASTSQLLNPTTGDWESSLFELLGLPLSLMAPLVSPGTRVGKLHPSLASITGLKGVPVIAVAAHDTASAVTAVPAVDENFAYLSSGTWSLMGIETRNPLITTQTRKLNLTNEGGSLGTYRILKNITGLWLFEECRRSWGNDKNPSYQEITAAAQKAPAFQSLIDPDSPEFLNPPDMPEAIQKFCLRTGQPPPQTQEAFIRCIFESLALKYRHTLNQLRLVSPYSIDRLHIIGGGSRNRLLCRWTAEACALPVAAGPAEATAIGNIMLQAWADGRVSGLAEIRQAIRKSYQPVEYTPENPETWEQPYKRFTELLDT